MAVASALLTRVLVLGDSLTAGWTSFSSGPLAPFAPHLQRALATHHVKSEVTPAGAPGRAAAQGMHPLKQQLAAGSFGSGDACIVLLGANDLLSSFPPSTHHVDGVISHLKALHAAVRATGAKSIAMGLLDHPAFSEHGDALKAINARIEHEVGADAYVDGFSLVSSRQSALWSADRIHMTPEGYTALGQAMAAPLADILKPAAAAAHAHG